MTTQLTAPKKGTTCVYKKLEVVVKGAPDRFGRVPVWDKSGRRWLCLRTYSLQPKGKANETDHSGSGDKTRP